MRKGLKVLSILMNRKEDLYRNVVDDLTTEFEVKPEETYQKELKYYSMLGLAEGVIEGLIAVSIGKGICYVINKVMK